MKYFFFIILICCNVNLFSQKYFYKDSVIKSIYNLKIEIGYNKDTIYNIHTKGKFFNYMNVPVFVILFTNKLGDNGAIFYYGYQYQPRLKASLKNRKIEGVVWEYRYSSNSDGTTFVSKSFYKNGLQKRKSYDYVIWDSTSITKRCYILNKEKTQLKRVRRCYSKPIHKVHHIKEFPIEFQQIILNAKRKHKYNKKKLSTF